MKRTWLSREVWWVLLAAWATRGAYLLIRPADAVSIDLKHWIHVAILILSGENPYEKTTYLNWPPVWPLCLKALAQISIDTNIPLSSLIIGFLILAESVAIVLLMKLLAELGHTGWKSVLVGVALNPALIFQVTQHANFDVLMMIFVLAGFIQLIRFHRTGDSGHWVWACAWVGLGVLTKTVPLALIPLLWIGTHPLSRPTRLLGIAVATLPAIIAVSTLYTQAPEAIWQNVIRYRSFGGWYGITGLMGLAGASPQTLNLYSQAVSGALLIWLVAGSILLSRHKPWEAKRLVLASSITFLTIVTLGSGYGPQYIWWYWPGLMVSFLTYRRQHTTGTLLLPAAGIVLIGTYCLEYLTLKGHGGWLWPQFGLQWGSQQGQTLLRLPQFILSLAVLAYGLFLLQTNPSKVESPTTSCE